MIFSFLKRGREPAPPVSQQKKIHHKNKADPGLPILSDTKLFRNKIGGPTGITHAQAFCLLDNLSTHKLLIYALSRLTIPAW